MRIVILEKDHVAFNTTEYDQCTILYNPYYGYEKLSFFNLAQDYENIRSQDSIIK